MKDELYGGKRPRPNPWYTRSASPAVFSSHTSADASRAQHRGDDRHRVLADERLLVVGGLARSDLSMQVIAEACDWPVATFGDEVEAPLGAAMLAALGVGLLDEAGMRASWATPRPRALPREASVALPRAVCPVPRVALGAAAGDAPAAHTRVRRAVHARRRGEGRRPPPRDGPRAS